MPRLSRAPQEATEDRVVLLSISDDEIYHNLRRLSIHHSGTDRPLDMGFVVMQILSGYFNSRGKD